MTIDYAKARKLNTRARGLLTRAEKSADVDYRERTADKVEALYDEMGVWPDEWHRLSGLRADTRWLRLKMEQDW